MEKKLLITMDIEQDISRFLKDSYIGVEKGLQPFLDLLKKYGLLIDFFVTSDVCRRYSKLVKGITDQGHRMGCHGYDHSIRYYCKMSYEKQFEDITKATKELEDINGSKPKMFRTPNFSANGDTIKILEQLGYETDSSILSGRHVKKWKLFTIYDFRKAPRVPYHPSTKDVTKKGDSSVLEIPLTINPHLEGAPVCMGYLNYAGLDKTIAAINEVNSKYITFLIHPWDLVDLEKYHPNLKPWVYKLCSSDLNPLDSLLEHIKSNFGFTTIEEIKQESIIT